MYKLFIDDERFPVGNNKEWIIARTVDEAKNIINILGFPIFISFDHDLGHNEPSGYDFVKWIVEQDQTYNILPTDFSFYVHSQNPIGAKNIKSLLNNWLDFKKNEI